MKRPLLLVTALFAAFPATESVKVRLIAESGQRAVTVGPGAPRVDL